MTSALGSCKYGAECGMTLNCECDCCIDVHPCECEPENDDDYVDRDDTTEVTHAVARAPRGSGKGAAGRETGDVISEAAGLNEPTKPRSAHEADRGCSTATQETT